MISFLGMMRNGDINKSTNIKIFIWVRRDNYHNKCLKSLLPSNSGSSWTRHSKPLEWWNIQHENEWKYENTDSFDLFQLTIYQKTVKVNERFISHLHLSLWCKIILGYIVIIDLSSSLVYDNRNCIQTGTSLLPRKQAGLFT